MKPDKDDMIIDAVKEATAYDILAEAEKLRAEFKHRREHTEAFGIHVFIDRLKALYHLADAPDGAKPCPPLKKR